MSRSAARAVRVGLLGLIASACAGPPAPAPPAPASSLRSVLSSVAAKNLASFDHVWRTIDEKHWDPALVGADWDRARDELRPRVAAARSVGEAREILRQLVGRLGQSHFAIMPPEMAELTDGEDRECKPGDLGFDARASGGVALVTRVESGGAAAGAGVHAGWVVDRVDDAPVAALIERVGRTFPGERAAASEAVMRLL
jgi:carboxyl-terminal processing protease